MIRALRVEETIERWHEIGPLFETALKLDMTGLTTDGILEGHKAGLILIFEINGKAFMACELMEQDDERTGRVIALAGKGMKAWMPELIETMLKMFTEQGCNRVTVFGRPGWIKALKPHGFKQTSAMMALEIT